MNLIPYEEEEQIALIQYLEIKGIKYTAIPNSTYTKSWKQKKKNKDMGLNPGLPDLLLILPKKLLFIEMKRIKGGVVSKHQKEWIKALNSIGKQIEAVVCRGFEEAIKTIKKYEKTN